MQRNGCDWFPTTISFPLDEFSFLFVCVFFVLVSSSLLSCCRDSGRPAEGDTHRAQEEVSR